MSENDLSRKIRDLRSKHNLTLEDVAKVVGVGRSTVRKWETGLIENMRRDKIAKLATALHTTPGYLMGWDENPEFVPCNLFKPLKNMREALGLTAAYVAEKIGIDENAYLAIENGGNTDCITLAKIAVFFDCTTDHVLSFDGVMFEKENIEHARLSVLGSKPESGHHILSTEEAHVIHMFRSLSEQGRTRILSSLKLEYDQLSGEEAYPAPKEA